MNAKVKKTMFWAAMITPMVLGVYFLFGGYQALAAGPHGHGPGGMGQRGGFGGHHVMQAPHHGGFSWLTFLLILLIGIGLFVFLVKMFKKKAKASSMQQFIDTSLMSTHKPIVNNNESFLDQWEKNMVNKKETN